MWPSGVMRLTWQLETLMTHFLCCIENTVKDRIMILCGIVPCYLLQRRVKKFKLRPLSWTLKDVWYISGLKKRLISVGHLDEEGYHVGFRDQQYKVTKSSLVVAHGNKRGNLYMVKVHPEGIGVIINGSGSAAVWFGEAQESFLHNVSEDKETAEVGARDKHRHVAEASNILWARFIITAYLTTVYLRSDRDAYSRGGMARRSGSDEMRYSFRDTKSHQNSDTSKGSKNSGSFKDSERSDEEDSGDGAFSEEGGSETPQAPTWHEFQTACLSLAALRDRDEVVDAAENRVLIFVEDSWIEEPCSNVHQVGVEREVEVLRSFNWPPTELITEDGVLLERGYSQFDDVSSRYLVSKVS
ncbi:hypothetical protein Tco_1294033 [Tanacetum coccineum]